ncbi:acetyl-CoA carboxylase biotin carboxylase subunit family protein [Streptomyces sp. NPDC058000]|uniref:ATP-grasp domain-containing protein n=1 Tax=Streptomyces sp. NPDC058000 TaxID=3346299 RepID=UPI0036E56C20
MSRREHVVHVGFADQDVSHIDFDSYDVTLLLDAYNHSLMPQHTRDRFARIGIIDTPHRINVEDYDLSIGQMIDHVREFARDLGAPRAVVGLYEHTVLPAARLREAFGLPGTDVRTALLTRDKVLMKEALREVVRVPRYWSVGSGTTEAELTEIAAALPGKVVLKPKCQAASFGVEIFDDAESFLRHVRDRGIEDGHHVEEFVEGDVCHFDGFVRDGEIRFLHASRYLGDCFSFQYRREDLASVALDDPDEVAAIRDFTQRVLTTLGLRDSAFHLEAFRTPEGGLVFLEIAGRFGGGYIRRHFEVAYELDLIRESIAACMNLPSAVDRPLTNLDLRDAGRGVAGWVHPALREEARCRVTEVKGPDTYPASVILAETPEVGTVFNDAPGLFVGSGLFILAGESTAQIEQDARTIMDAYDVEVEVLPAPER